MKQQLISLETQIKVGAECIDHTEITEIDGIVSSFNETKSHFLEHLSIAIRRIRCVETGQSDIRKVISEYNESIGVSGPFATKLVEKQRLRHKID